MDEKMNKQMEYLDSCSLLQKLNIHYSVFKAPGPHVLFALAYPTSQNSGLVGESHPQHKEEGLPL